MHFMVIIQFTEIGGIYYFVWSACHQITEERVRISGEGYVCYAGNRDH